MVLFTTNTFRTCLLFNNQTKTRPQVTASPKKKKKQFKTKKKKRKFITLVFCQCFSFLCPFAALLSSTYQLFQHASPSSHGSLFSLSFAPVFAQPYFVCLFFFGFFCFCLVFLLLSLSSINTRI